MKIFCTDCKKIKSKSSFSKDKIRKNEHGWCKECRAKSRRKYYQKNKNLINYKRKNVWKYNQLSIKKYYKNQYKKNKIKYMARSKVKYALKKGLLKKLPCEECKNKKTQAHHNNYNQPLKVNWLCDYHHRIKHGRAYKK